MSGPKRDRHFSQLVWVERSGSKYKALCPFHRERTPSFNVDLERMSYRCFGCGASGEVQAVIVQIGVSKGEKA